MGMGDDLVAKMTFKVADEYALKLSRLATESDKIAQKAIYAGAKIVADEMKANLKSVLSSDQQGNLIGAMGIAPIEKDNQGDWNTKIGFDGYSGKAYKGFPKGTPNQLKARALESGTTKQRKRPFARPAVYKTKKKVQDKMAEIIDSETAKTMR